MIIFTESCIQNINHNYYVDDEMCKVQYTVS